MHESPPSRGASAHALAFGLYAALTLAWFWPLVPNLGSGFPHDAGDPALNAWILWWNSTVLPFTPSWWNAPSFFPTTGAAAFTELLVGINLVATPVFWVSHNPVVAYNVAFLLSFPLSAFAAYLLTLELCGDRRAAFVAGVAYGFAPYRIAQLPHLQVLAAYAMPTALLALHRYLRLKQLRWLVLFGVAWLVQALSNGYYLLFFTVFLVAWAAWFLSRRVDWRLLLRVGLAGLVAALPVVPILLKYRSVHASHGMARHLREIVFYSGDLTSFVATSPLLGLWGWLHRFQKPEGELFPGVAVLLVVMLGAIVALRRRPAPSAVWFRWLAIALAVIALATGLASVGYLLFGGWRVSIGSFTLLSVRHLGKPLSLFLLSGLGLCVLHPSSLQAVRERSAFVFYAAAALLAALTSLGPEPHLLGRETLSPAPYAYLLRLPGFDGLRVPTRFWMLAILCLSTAAGLAFARIVARWPKRALLVTLVAAASIAADAWPARMPVAPAPALPACAPDPSAKAAAFLQLPLGDVFPDIAAMLRARARGLPSVNGFSGYIPADYVVLRDRLASGDSRVLAEMSALGALEVAIDVKADGDRRSAHFVARYPGARELPGCGPDLRVFVLPGSPSH